MDKWLVVFIDRKGNQGWFACDSEEEAKNEAKLINVDGDSLWIYPPLI